MEQKIIFIGTRKIHSEKKKQDYFMVDYTQEDVPYTDYITLEEYNRISEKAKNLKYKEATGIFKLNSYRNLVLCDIK